MPSSPWLGYDTLLGSLSPSHGSSPLAAGALEFWAESLPCRDPFLQWSSAIPHGLPWLFPHSPIGTPTLRSLDLNGFGVELLKKWTTEWEGERYGKGKRKRSTFLFLKICILSIAFPFCTWILIIKLFSRFPEMELLGQLIDHKSAYWSAYWS